MNKNNTKDPLTLILYSLIISLLILLKSFNVVGYAPEYEQCNDTGTVSDLSIFEREQVPEITIEFNFEWVMNCKTDDEFPATLIYHSPDGSEDLFHIKIRARGNTRRNQGVCSFPPLKINLRKSEVENTIFHGQNKLKLVTHCRNNNVFEGYALQEYYVYRTYNLLTDTSLRVQLANITYIDTSGKDKSVTRYGFFIENKKELAQRLDGEILPRKVITQETCNQASMSRFNMFQFMIGNTDWWVTTQHNVVLFKNESTSFPVPIPYDFDYAGIINTSYSIPHESLPISNVRQRYYKGTCLSRASYEETVQYFQNKKNEIFELYENSDHLSNKQKKSALNYYGSFYEILDDAEAMQKYIQLDHSHEQLEL
ncbi:hypothetical protein ACFLU5_05480 [Bacteroidota bacterium]